MQLLMGATLAGQQFLSAVSHVVEESRLLPEPATIPRQPGWEGLLTPWGSQEDTGVQYTTVPYILLNIYLNY